MVYTPLPVGYRKSSEPIVTYDWIDVANGIGYQTFFLSDSYNAAAITYFLTNTAVFCDLGKIVGGDTANFETNAFVTPRVLEGDAIFDIYAGSGGGSVWSCTGTLFHVHISGAGDTSLGTFTVRTEPASGGNFKRMTTMAIAKTTLQIGDQLKLRVVMGGDSAKSLWLDPTGLGGLAGTSKIHFPFRIQE